MERGAWGHKESDMTEQLKHTHIVLLTKNIVIQHISKLFLSSITEAVYPLNRNIPFPSSPNLWQPTLSCSFSEFNYYRCTSCTWDHEFSPSVTVSFQLT